MHDATAVAAARRILTGAIARGIFPCAVANVGDSRGTLWSEAFGRLTPQADAAATADTWFDLASLTKPLATAAVIFDLVGRGALSFDTPVSTLLPFWQGRDRDAITVADLLEHAAGLPARLATPPPAGAAGFRGALTTTPLAYPPRARAEYSDLGFILLAFIAEDCARTTLDAAFGRVLLPVVAEWAEARSIGFAVPAEFRAATAPTWPLEEDPRPGPLQAVVHDSYAAALGGAAGHAGLFGTAAAVAALGRAVVGAARGRSLDGGAFSTELIQRAIMPSTVPGSSRGLGWDRMRPTSSCGERMSPGAFGHVGFTGTSLWIDPDRDRYYVLLTNRAFRGGTLNEIREVRRAFHDALVDL